MRITGTIAAYVVAIGITYAQEPKFDLSGIFDIGSSNSSSNTQLFQHPGVVSGATDLSWGLDLNLRNYILDPRFITLTFEPSFHRGTGRTDAQQTREGDTGGAFYLDFLKDSFTPFRFHFVDHSLSYEQQHLNSASVARRSIGFEWTFRKPKRPPVFINYDTSRFDYEFTLASVPATRTTSLLTGTQGNYAGWTMNAAYSHQSSTEAFTGTGTSTDLIRSTASRKLWSESELSTNTVYERVHLSNQPGTAGLEIPFWSIRTDLRTRHSNNLSTMLSHQYYRTGAEAVSRVAESGGAKLQGESTTINDIRGQISYRLSQSLTLGAASSSAFVSMPMSAVETAVRTISLSGSLQWRRQIKFLQTRASQDQGFAYAGSNMGNSRRVPFETSTAGLSIGDPRRILISGDGTYSQRPDMYELGGKFTQRQASGSVETQAIRRFLLRGSAGVNEYEYLTLRGRERFRNKTYSATVSRSIVSLTMSRNADVSLRNLLQESAMIAPQQLFVTLPIEALRSAPFSGTTGAYTSAAFTIRPRKRFELDGRYLRQRVLFTNTPSVLLRQYEAFGSYHLGKFVLTAGILYLGDSLQDEVHSLRRYYFFRISRPFRIY